MPIKALHPELQKYLKSHGLEKKFQKQASLFQKNPNHPSLNVEVLEPKHRRIYSFRIDRKYRAMFIIHQGETIILDINNHYQ